MAGKGRYLVLIGGVANDYKFLNDIHVIDLTLNKNTTLSSTEDFDPDHPFASGIAYHGAFGTN
jgi:hypothetical protein